MKRGRDALRPNDCLIHDTRHPHFILRGVSAPPTVTGPFYVFFNRTKTPSPYFQKTGVKPSALARLDASFAGLLTALFHCLLCFAQVHAKVSQ